MLKFLELLDHLERQIAAGRQLVEQARLLPGSKEMDLIDLEDEMDSLEMRVADVMDEEQTMAVADELNNRSDALYRRLLAVGKAITLA